MVDHVAEAAAQAAQQAALRHPVLAAKSALMDRATIQILGALMPSSQHLRELRFADCRLDCGMLTALRRALNGNSTVEALQLEWNPLDLPLPSAQELEAAAASLAAMHPTTSATTPGGASSVGGAAAAALAAVGPAGGDEAAAGQSDSANLEARERLRYRLQSLRGLRAFRMWLSDLNAGGLDAVWQALEDSEVPADKPLSAREFQDLFEAAAGAAGPQIIEAFEVLDGPDYAAGAGRVSVCDLRSALAALPEESDSAEEAASDPIGTAFAGFLDGECTLESLSFRACAIGFLELSPVAQALAKGPWQLRSLNLWDNRVCDRGARALAGALESYRGLQYLGLGRNRITDAGVLALCRPFEELRLDPPAAQQVRDKIKDQEGKIEAKAKAAAKAAAKAKAAPAPEPPKMACGRLIRQAPEYVDELEERPPAAEGEEPTFIHRRPCELKIVILSENPVRDAQTIEALQPLGPKGVELVLKQTPAATALMAKRPELATKERKPFCPSGDGWVVRVS